MVLTCHELEGHGNALLIVRHGCGGIREYWIVRSWAILCFLSYKAMAARQHRGEVHDVEQGRQDKMWLICPWLENCG